MTDRIRKVLSNLVNYKSFGFTKIIPRAPEAAFSAIVEKSANAKEAGALWSEVSRHIREKWTEKSLPRRLKLKDHIYSTAPETSNFVGKRSLGHVSNYYPGEVITDEEVAAVQAAAEKLGVDILNTR